MLEKRNQLWYVKFYRRKIREPDNDYRWSLFGLFEVGEEMKLYISVKGINKNSYS